MNLSVSKRRVTYSPDKDYKRQDGKVMLEASSTIFIGKYKGRKVESLVQDNPTYLIVLNKRSKFFSVAEDVLKAAWNRLDFNNFREMVKV